MNVNDMGVAELRLTVQILRPYVTDAHWMESQLKVLVPQTYREAVLLYPWLVCESHEWDNRTTDENIVWLVEAVLALTGHAAEAEGGET